MLVHKMTDVECRSVVARAQYGRLGCVSGQQPYIVPVALYLDSDEPFLYGFSTFGQKIRWMRANPRVCVEVEEIVSRKSWTTVIVFGRYQEIPRSGPGVAVRRRAAELLGTRADWWLPGGASLASGEEHGVSVLYRIRIGRMTGRRTAAA
jgi:nitroimidazol reductase NimA-like FMN-containing flavoprotein (pyridoxamine 5'-phosphate oxidase superfamily)